MEKVAKKGDMLFIGEDEDTLVVVVLGSLEYKGDNYLKVVVTPMMVEKAFDEEKVDTEFAKEIVEEDKYYLDPVLDPAMIKTLKEEYKKQNSSEKEPIKN